MITYLLVVANASGSQVHLVDADNEAAGVLCGYRFRSNAQVGTYAMVGPESIAPTFSCTKCATIAKGN